MDWYPEILEVAARWRRPMGRAGGEKAAAVPKSAAMRMAVRDIICHKNAYIRLFVGNEERKTREFPIEEDAISMSLNWHSWDHSIYMDNAS